MVNTGGSGLERSTVGLTAPAGGVTSMAAAVLTNLFHSATHIPHPLGRSFLP